MKRVLMTGATGFIGQHCIPILLDSGFEVYATYRNKILERYREKVNWVKTDILGDLSLLKKLIESNRIEYLFHLAWDVTPGEYPNSSNNLKWLESSLNLIESFIQAGGKRVVTAGTCFEYGFSAGILKEDSTPLKPDTLYGECKAALYSVVRRYCQVQSTSYAHGRIFYVFGPGEDERRVVPYVIKALQEGRTANCSSGVQELDYLYVKDVAKAFVQILDCKIQGAVNIGSGKSYSLRFFLEIIQKVMGIRDMINFALPQPNETKHIVADITILSEQIGWQSSYSSYSGIVELLKEMDTGGE